MALLCSEVEDPFVLGALQAVVSDVGCFDALLVEQVCESGREVGVEEELHPAASGSSRSCTAAAAYSNAATMSGSSRSGKSARISSCVRPAASWPITVLTGIRRSRIQGRPPIFR